MKKEITVFGKILIQYKIPKQEIEDLNKIYEKAKENLNSYSQGLVGHLKSELEFLPLLESTQCYKTIHKCMEDYMNSLSELHLIRNGEKNLKIIHCWINDMQSGEYQQPHTHNNRKGWSTVLFLKVPEFIKTTKYESKFKDGKLGFMNPNAIDFDWYEPEVGDFYMFEASHSHMVMPFKSVNNELRRSMSFNFIWE